MPLRSSHKFILSTVLLWLFTISGIIGMVIGDQQWFLSLTPLNLLIYLGILLWNSDGKHTAIALCIPIGIGWFVEFLGVHYGWIFGTYTYGENLGYKIAGVPVMIGINWAILTYCTAALATIIATRLSDNVMLNRWIAIVVAALLMTGLDIIIEVSAPRFDFWEFKDGHVPIQNYMGWLGTALLIQFLFQKKMQSYHYSIAIHVFSAIFLFFTAFLFL